MKIYKLKKSDLNDLFKLYKRIDCIYEDRYAFPYHTYVSKKTYKEFEKTTRQLFKKQHPYITKKALDYSVGLHLLNLAPCELHGLSDNIVLVDSKAVQNCIEELKGKE
jgi:hypothetical protein